MPKREKTVGQLSQELLQKEPEQASAIDYEQEIHKGYVDHILECAERSKAIYPEDFYIVVETKKEKLMPNVIRNYIFGRSSCPTPSYDQTVYRFHRQNEKIEFLWVVPSRDICHLLVDNALNVDNEERDLLNFVLDFNDKTLLKRAKILNGEVSESNILQK